ncbi:LysR family transcriptional regulator [Paenibacillus aestuarii]|uniref:LysR family transcriptional regulator n=1 Tax=Paenibacillus aestuarii TaxID=516965 RepID=A0ABW0KER8_9BACL|nr:LysR family transcriptional regulator [Paenibacillus aestuarii]
MKTEWLEAFLQTVELKSLTKASEMLHVSQPALSKQIRNLENELGTQLLIRSTIGVTLTPSGEILHESSKRIMSEVNTMKREIALAEGKQVHLTIGSWPSIAALYLPQRIAGNKLTDTHSAYKIRVFYSFFDMLKSLETGTIDAALFDDRGVKHDFLASLLFTEAFLLFVNVNHPLYGNRQEVTFAEIANEAFVMLPEGCDVRMLVDHAFAAKGKKLHISFEIELGQSILGFIQANLGIAILPEIFVQQTNETVKAIPISDFGLTRQISAITREQSASKQLLTLFDSVLPSPG